MGLFSFTGSFTTQMGISKAKIRRGIYNCLLLESRDLTSCWAVKRRSKKKSEKSRLEVSRLEVILDFKDKSFTLDDAREFMFGWMNACENLMDFKIGPFKCVGTYKYLNGNHFEIQVTAGRGEEVAQVSSVSEEQVPAVEVVSSEIPSVSEEKKVLDDVEKPQPKKSPSMPVYQPTLPYPWTCACGIQHESDVTHCYGCSHDRPTLLNPWTCACGIAHESNVAYCYECSNYRYTVMKQQAKTNGTKEE